MKKRILAMALTAAMMLSLFPASVFALPESQPTASSSEIVAQLNESASGDSQPAASEKTNSEPTAASEKAASSEAASSEVTSSEAASSEAASSEATSSEAASSEAASSEPAQAEEPKAEKQESKLDALKNALGRLFGGEVAPASIVDPKEPTDTYEFYVNDARQDDLTQYITSGSNLKLPATPQKEGFVFEGWFIGEEKLTDGMTRTVTGGKTVRVEAKFAAASYVRFVDTDNKTVVHTAKGKPGELVSQGDLETAAKKVNLNKDQSVTGWNTKENADAEMTAIQFAQGTVTLYPVVKTGYWVTFDSNGGSYVEPLFGKAGTTVEFAAITPKRAGYTFDGWFMGETRVTAANGTEIVVAHWTPAQAQYTVIYWLENADDTEYSFVESVVKTGLSGEQAVADPKPYEGFDLNKEKTEPKTIAGDGSTILNVYYSRNWYDVKFYGGYFHKDKEYTQYRIHAKYGADISSKWPRGTTWSVTDQVLLGPWQSHIDTMPLGGKNFYGPKERMFNSEAGYYLEALPDETGVESQGRIYKLDHTDTAAGGLLSVSQEDKYPIKGFDYSHGTPNGQNYDGAKFYYNRQEYQIKFVNGGTVDTKQFKYQYPIESANYTPDPPSSIPEGYHFDGWYEDDQFTSEKFAFAGKTMPANNITLYAKWAAPEITVTILMGDNDKQTIPVKYGSKLSECETWNNLVSQLQPDAWMKDGKIFNPETKLHENIILTPYYKNEATPCTITYVEGENSWSDTAYAKGSMATILKPRYSEGLEFQYWKMGDKQLLPGESINITSDVTLTAEYGVSLTLTYHNGNTPKQIMVPANSKQTAADPATLWADFKASPDKEFAGWATTENGTTVEYEIGDVFYVSTQGSNDLYVVWKDKINIGEEGRLKVEGLSDVTYNGQEQKQKPTSVTDQKTGKQLVEGTDYELDYTGQNMKDAGTVTITIRGKGKYINTATCSYEILKRQVTLTGEEATKVYDGTPLKNTTVKVTKGEFVEGEAPEYFTQKIAQITNVGSRMNYIEVQWPFGSDAYKNYDIRTEDKFLIVTPRKIKLTSATDSKQYDGEPLMNATVTAQYIDKDGNVVPTEKGFVDGEGAAYTVTGKQTDAGSSKNNFTYTLNENTLKENYEIECEFGTLTVTHKNVNPEIGTGMTVEGIENVKYNGKAQMLEPVVKNGEKTLTKDADYTLTYSHEDRDFTNVTGKDITVHVKGIGNYEGEVTRTYQITKRSLILKAASETRVYNGESWKNETYTIDENCDGLAPNETPKVSVQAQSTVKDVTTGDGVANHVFLTQPTQGKFNAGNYTIEAKPGFLKVIPATLTITTKSASKTYDGNDLTEPNGYSIDGLVKGETVNFSITGRQKEVGSSDNTYVIDWNKSTAKQGNYTIVDKLGKLTVTSSGSSSGGSSSGGGSSTPTPAPEQAPTPTPAPVIVPAAPTPAPTPVRRVAPAATATPAPAAKPTETIAESEPPKAESEPEVIEDEETPLAPMATGKWALVNLVLMILTVLASLLMLLGVIGKKRGRNNKSFWRIASLIPAIGALAAFVLTENMKLPMAMVDRWTLLMVIIAVLQLIVAAMSKKQNESEDDGANA